MKVVCKKCLQYKLLSDFSVRKYTKNNGYTVFTPYRTCKSCRNAHYANKRRKEGARENLKWRKTGLKKCTKCGNEKQTGQFFFIKSRNYFTPECRDCRNERRSKWRKANRDKERPSKRIRYKKSIDGLYDSYIIKGIKESVKKTFSLNVKTEEIPKHLINLARENLIRKRKLKSILK